jgi:DNA-binding NtrC family response regulator
VQSTILVVNQEPALAWTIERALRHEDVQLLSACSITEARSILGANKVDVVISDQCLAETPGSEFLSWVGSNYPDSVGLLLASEQDLHAVVAAINSGQTYKFLSKPWTNDALRTVVRDAVGKAQEGQIDVNTGWLTHRSFCARASAVLASRQLRIVVCEIRNATTAWAMLDDTQRLVLAQKIADRCNAAAGDPVVPHASRAGLVCVRP